MARTITTSIEIAAPPIEVWAALTDFTGPRDWDPFFARLGGELREGATWHNELRRPGGRTMTFRPVVQEVRPGSRLSWLGRLLVPGLFDGLHSFELHPQGSGTRLVQQERFSGALVPFCSRMLDETEQGFASFNEALARRCAQAERTR